MKRRFRRPPRTEFIDDPRTPEQQARDAAELAAHERAHPPSPARREASLERARALHAAKSAARSKLEAMGEIPWFVHFEKNEEAWVAREPHLLLEETGRTKQEVAKAIARAIEEEMHLDPVHVLDVLRSRVEPESVTVRIAM